MSSVSSFSNASSRSEHMAYYTAELGLDKSTAALLYRAERLQEKGQLEQAIRYYDKVIAAKPDCSEAVENQRIIREELEERKKKTKALPTVSENSKFYQPIVTEMDVFWSAIEDALSGKEYPDIEQEAFAAGRALLRKTGHGNSLLKLIENKIVKTKCDADTDWCDHLEGKARFQVTLVPDQYEDDTLLLDLLASMMQTPECKKPNAEPEPKVKTDLPIPSEIYGASSATV